MRTEIKKWGNSASLRIPAAVLAAANLRVDASVDVREEGGRIVIDPVRDEAVSLDSLLARIVPDNLHDEADFGAPVGRELL
ncbi:MAG: AbrB/MazE/SpoVT family DNA-binding domain-containing protein [Xanthomonadales bacterium PRO7]|jgi:antitoxin MazE|nr:AbrB/MazE/SpoVT family DNA-binding domain-containing protein [Xanthomonadales bacterium PRO7]HMM58367.1 AbrB/MazE/SpoVT family DNA-binding domain-containing protein [Rudaea sp.]